MLLWLNMLNKPRNAKMNGQYAYWQLNIKIGVIEAHNTVILLSSTTIIQGDATHKHVTANLLLNAVLSFVQICSLVSAIDYYWR